LALDKPRRVGPWPFPKEDPAVRKKDFREVQEEFTIEQARSEADRCLRCGNPVCMDSCPVQMDVRGMCDAVAKGDLKTAYHRIRETNALVGVTARCCPQLQGLCEDACVMRWNGHPISIGMIQKFVADWEQRESKQPDPAVEADTGKSVSIVGSGPAGLAAASLLRRYGHKVTVYEELGTPGGTAWYGIPDYHLPKDVLEYEVYRIKGLGVEIKTGVKVGESVTLSSLLSESDAVLLTTGSKDVNTLDTPGVGLKGVVDAYQFLEDVYVDGVETYQSRKQKYDLGKEVIVVGGGDSALDAARTALRLTQGHLTVVYRRTEIEMRADPLMTEEAKEEGVEFKFLTDPTEYKGTSGRVSSAVLSVMQLGKPDESGRKAPEPTGKTFEMPCDSVLLAIGRGPNSFLQKKEGLRVGRHDSIAIDDRFSTSMARVFAAGDVTTGETLVVKAMGQGREAAQRVHEFLTGITDKHVSLYEQYYQRKTSEQAYQDMLLGKEEVNPPD